MSGQGPINFFPRYLDRPRLIGIFEIDEFFLAFIIMTAIVTISLAFPQFGSLSVMITAVVSGLGVATLYSKAKRNRPDGYAAQKLYRKGIISPADQQKTGAVFFPHIKNMGKVIPYGFTSTLYS
ncbi:type IV conjugative transfer system protein TraL [Campylobacter sp. MOP7]|uniref:type IV conjugative transfer system protein TraL n=1 Tax=Campylobacter canis TaxID=3378588 RepID=UPI00387E46AD